MSEDIVGALAMAEEVPQGASGTREAIGEAAEPAKRRRRGVADGPVETGDSAVAEAGPVAPEEAAPPAVEGRSPRQPRSKAARAGR